MNTKTNLENTLSAITKTQVEITVRGFKEFTISAEGNKETEFRKAESFLKSSGQAKDFQFQYDPECDFSCLFFSVV